MDENILNIEQAVEFLGVSEKTLIKLLREEHVPARKIGREWRFSKVALINWLSTGDSSNYINKNEIYQVSQDENGKSEDLLNGICEKIQSLKNVNNIKQLLEIYKDIDMPKDASLRFIEGAWRKPLFLFLLCSSYKISCIIGSIHTSVKQMHID